MSLRLFSLGMAALALIEKPELKTRLREAKPLARKKRCNRMATARIETREWIIIIIHSEVQMRGI